MLFRSLENLTRGADRVGRSRDQFEIIANPLTAIGSSKEAIAAQREVHRTALATIFSTPNYWPSLKLFGWDDVGLRLNELVREGRWDDLPALLSDEMLNLFVPSGHCEEIPDMLMEEFGALAEGIYISLPEDPAEDRMLAGTIERLQRG